MARLVGLILLVLGVYLGASIATQGVDATLAAWSGREAPVAEADSAGAAVAVPREAAPSGAAPSGVTSRVRERVNGALAEGARRRGGE